MTSPLIGKKYATSQLLRESMGVATWSGTALDGGNNVVIKLAAASLVSASARMRLENTSKKLSALRNSSIVVPLESGQDEGRFYFVSPFLSGQTVEESLHAPMDVAEALRVFVSILKSLDALHNANIICMDLKPANVLLQNGSAHLLDFCFARSLFLSDTSYSLSVDAVRYLSPEQAGLLQADIGPRADLYSAGLLLFEMLTCTQVFPGQSVSEVLRNHISQPPPDPRRWVPEVPRLLNDVIQRLLQVEPGNRYQTARAVLHDLENIQNSFAAGVSDPDFVIGTKDTRVGLTEPAFVGREAELGQMIAATENLRGGNAGIVTLEAPSGGGKSRLLSEFTFEMTRRGYLIASGHVPDQTAMRPFQVLDGVVEEVLQRAGHDAQFRETLEAVLADQSEVLVSSLPALQRLLGARNSDQRGTEAHGEFRIVRALSTFLSSLGSAAQPAVIVLDDCQWIDSMTMKLLAYWNNETQSEKCFVSIILGMREDEVPKDHPIRKLKSVQHIRLKPFGIPEIRLLLTSMAGNVPASVVETIARLSEGNAFLSAELMRGVVEIGVLRGEHGSWQVDELALANVQSSRKAAQVLARRLELLSVETQDVLKIAAVVGKEFGLDVLAPVSGLEPGKIIELLQDARSRQIIWIDGSGARFAFMHDKLRETMLAGLSAESRTAIHLKLAEHLRATEPARFFEISHHFGRSGKFADALEFALQAAESARERHELETAAYHYRIAANGMIDAEAPTKFRVLSGLGDVLMLQANYEEAQAQYEAAIRTTDDRYLRATIHSNQGEINYKRGIQPEASREYIRALRLLGYKVPDTKAGFALGALLEWIIQAFHSFFPKIFTGRRKLENARNDLLAVQLFQKLGLSIFFHSGPIAAMWSFMRELNLAETYPETRELARAKGDHGTMTGVIFFRKRSLRFFNTSIEMARKMGDLYGYAICLHRIGFVTYFDGDLDGALERLFEADKLFMRIGDSWELSVVWSHIALSFYRQGRFREARAYMAKVMKQSLEVNDHFMISSALAVLAQLDGGNVPEDILDAAIAYPDKYNNRLINVLVADALRWVQHGEFRKATEIMEKAQEISRRALTEHVSRPVPWMMTVYRYELEQLSEGDAPRRNEILRKMKPAMQVALKLARKSTVYRFKIHREHALYLAVLGQHHRALAILDAQIHETEKSGALYELALNLAARAEVRKALYVPGAQADAERAQEIFVKIEAPEARQHSKSTPVAAVTASLADRFTAIIDEGRKMVSSLSDNIVFEAIGEAAKVLLRSEVVKIADASECAQYGLETRVIRGPQACLVYEKIFSRQSASALLAPLLMRGEVRAWLLVCHHEIADLFGEEEARVAEYIVALGGAALENAAGYSDMQAVTHELLHLVDDGKRISSAASLPELTSAIQNAFKETLKQMPLTETWYSEKCFPELMLDNGFYQLDSEGKPGGPLQQSKTQSEGVFWLQIEDARTHETVAFLSVQCSSSVLGDKEISILQALGNNAANAISAIRLRAAMNLVEERTKEIRTIFSNITQGICTVDAEMLVGVEYSACLEQLFGSTALTGKPLDEVLFSHTNVSEDVKSQVRAVASTCVGWDEMIFRGNYAILPRTVDRMVEGVAQSLELDWIPLVNDSREVTRIMVVVRDVTELRILRNDSEERRRHMAMVDEVLSISQEKFQAFVKGSLAVLDEVRNAFVTGAVLKGSELQRMKREIHTLKGNSRLLGFSELSEAMHRFEDVVFHLPDAVQVGVELAEAVGKSINVACGIFEVYQKLNDKMIGRMSQSRFANHRDLLVQISRFCAPNAGRGLNAAELRNLQTMLRKGQCARFVDFNHHLEEATRKIAETLGKPAPDFKVQAENVYVTNEFLYSLGSILTHIYRNSVDHGLAKDAPGHIEIRFESSASDARFLSMDVSDSGAGLRLADLRAKGLANGQLKTDDSDEQVAELIFASGVSTAKSVSEISGRGVGMDAVREMLLEKGCRIQIVFRGPANAGRRPFSLRIEFPQEMVCQLEEYPDSTDTTFMKSA